jgi:hypothetical protein
VRRPDGSNLHQFTPIYTNPIPLTTVTQNSNIQRYDDTDTRVWQTEALEDTLGKGDVR